jgi:DNA adenine methylase
MSTRTRTPPPVKNDLSSGRPVPFVKWAGGKTQLLESLLAFSPLQFGDYYEPFLGGGALYFALWTKLRIGHAFLSDLNVALINTYIAVRDHPGDVLLALRNMERSYKRADSRADYYYAMRESEPRTKVRRAARFIFLNKTCYNGLYRVNKKGKFNVPFGRYSNPTICDESNLRLAGAALGAADLEAIDFKKALCGVSNGDFIYLDPPYYPLSKTANFTGYTPGRFGFAEQKELAAEFDRLHRVGAYVMLSNADHHAIHTLYAGKGYAISEVKANRIINRDASRRGPIKEIIVRNYGQTLTRSTSPKRRAAG